MITKRIAEDTDDMTETEKERHYCVVQRNDLIRSVRYTIVREEGKGPTFPTATERKLMLYLLSKLKPDMAKFKEEVIDIRHFYEVIGADADDGDQYNRLKKTAREMWNLTITIYDSKYPEGKDLHFLSSKANLSTPGAIEFKLNDDLIPYLLKLKGNYTQYIFRNVLCMRSQYAIILYQILKSYSYNKNTVTFLIDDLKANLDAESYENFTNFKKKVMEPAIRDINKYSDLMVSVDYNKTGRSFTHAVFTMKNLEKPSTLEDLREAQIRHDAVTKKLDPNQITFSDIVQGGVS